MYLQTVSFVKSPSYITISELPSFSHKALTSLSLWLSLPVIINLTLRLHRIRASSFPSPLLAPVIMTTDPSRLSSLYRAVRCLRSYFPFNIYVKTYHNYLKEFNSTTCFPKESIITVDESKCEFMRSMKLQRFELPPEIPISYCWFDLLAL